MTPEAAVERQIERYREMTCEQGMATALRLHDLGCEVARMGIRRQHPEASTEQVEALLRERLALARS